MTKLSKAYDVSQHYRSIDTELHRATVKQFFKTSPEYLSIKHGEQLVVIDINEANNLHYYIVDN